MSREPILAFDGPAGAGKSTVARMVAVELGLRYVDTGAMYRAVTLEVLRHGVDPEDEEGTAVIARSTSISLNEAVLVNGEDVTAEIRSPVVNRHVSAVSACPGVREAMVLLQRKMAAAGGVVMDGRDIGSVVLPHADVKFYLTATGQERARRRYKELLDKGFEVTFDEILSDVNSRDLKDSSRRVAPLTIPDNAVLLDTTDMTVDEVVDEVLRHVRSTWQA